MIINVKRPIGVPCGAIYEEDEANKRMHDKSGFFLTKIFPTSILSYMRPFEVADHL